MSSFEITITLSNLFIQWYNSLPQEDRIPIEKLLSNLTIRKAFLNQYGNLFYVSDRGSVISYEDLNRPILTFKGTEYKLHIIEDSQSNFINVLDEYIVFYIVNTILTAVNYGPNTSNPTCEDIYFI
jgi:hypothetical protein